MHNQYNRSTTDIDKLNGVGEAANAIPGLIAQRGQNTSLVLSGAPIASGILQQLGVPANSQTIAALEAVGALSGTPAQLLNDYANVVNQAFTVAGVNQPEHEIRDNRDVTGDANVGVNMLLKGGARIAIIPYRYGRRAPVWHRADPPRRNTPARAGTAYG